MYRPKKRKLVRRASVASVVALVAAAGLGATLISQSGATSTALKFEKAAPVSTESTASGATTRTTTTPKYHLVTTRHDDDGSSSND
jgi:hypothetical protein